MNLQGIGDNPSVDRPARLAQQPQHFLALLTCRPIQRPIETVALHWHPWSVSRGGHDADDRDGGERMPIAVEGTPHSDDAAPGGTVPDQIAHDA